MVCLFVFNINGTDWYKYTYMLVSVCLCVCVCMCVQLYDATGGRMKLLMIRPCEPSVSGWLKGDFLENLSLVVWARDDARAFVYKLSAR